MILCIDIGNTNIKYAVFDGNEIKGSFRVSSRHSRTADEYGATLMNLLASKEIDRKDIEGIIMSSVIPSLNYTISHMCEYFFGVTPMIVGAGIKTGINVKADNPKEVGADIIANCVGAFTKYGDGKPMIVIDFGTATTFDVLTGQGELIGVVIAPGIKTSLESLVSNTAQLPMIELEAPKSAIPKNTQTAMRAGIIFGFAGLVENIVKKIKTELGLDYISVTATGGMGEIIAKEVSCITRIDRLLTLEGLKKLYEINKKA
ncbi:MAG: type III pantothenate kinase [Clostridiales bacterium]|nr:type III pantothenate kinase [Clostridiales bacterium]